MLREKERNEASDIYEAAVREEREVQQRARNEYARLKKEEADIKRYVKTYTWSINSKWKSWRKSMGRA